jgi:regulator of sigma E protease
MEWALAFPIAAVTLGSAAGVLLKVVAIALAFGLIVFVHEGGHFLFARLAGMAVYEFSLGFGRPLLFSFKRGETQYSFRLWPFISYVRIAGMEPDDDHPRGFDKKPRWQRAIVLVAGCVMNFGLAVVLFIAMGLIFGKIVATNELAFVAPNTPAAKAGLMANDRLLGMNGQSGWRVEDIRAAIVNSRGHPVVFTVERKQQRFALSITPKPVDQLDVDGLKVHKIQVYQIGVSFAGRPVPMGVGEAIVGSVRDTIALLQEQIAGIIAMITRVVRVQGNVMGPVGIVTTMYTQAQQSWMNLFYMAALLSVAVGFLNLFPFPPLDGSRLLILAYEGAIGRSIDKQKELIVHLVGMVILLGLAAFLTFWDVQRLFHRGG